jgi:hypothetical protein
MPPADSLLILSTAALTGLAITRLLHESGVPAGVMQCVVGGGAVGAALLEQRIDGLFFTGSHATGTRIAKALAGRLVKLQLLLSLVWKRATLCSPWDHSTVAMSTPKVNLCQFKKCMMC